jgi:hypothetical protein
VQTKLLHPIAPSAPPHSRGLLTGPLPAVLALGVTGIYVATLAPVSDHAWQFYMAERMLDGARLYVDVGAADMHPPLFTWLAAAVAALGRLVGVSGLALYPGLVWLATAASLFAWWRVGPASGWLLGVWVIVLLPMAGPFFGQGEHLALVFALPYLAGAATTAEGRPPARKAGLAAALAAAVGLAMKPYFALVWLAVEVLVARRRGWRSFLRAESVTIAAVFVLYVVATAVVTPTLFRLLPWLMALYPRFAPAPFMTLLLDPRGVLVAAGLVAAWLLRDDARVGQTARILGATCLAMYAAVLLQGKGWGYHWYPACATAGVLIGLALRPLAARFAPTGVLLAIIAVAWMQLQWNRTIELVARYPGSLPQMMEVVERHAPTGGSILGLTHLLQPGFPLVNLTGTRWSSPYAHLWMVPALYADAWVGRAPVRYRDTREFRAFEQQMFDRLWAAVERDDPHLTILQAPMAGGFDMRAYFETDARFRERFRRSPVLDTVGRYVILGRPARPR